MAKRRKPGAGRKPKPDRKVLFTIRLLPQVLAELRAQAQTWQGGNGNVSAFTESLINKGLHERAEERRDPALRGLLYFIAQLAERAGAFRMFIRKEELRARIPTLWRTDRLSFEIFKVAVRQLLDSTIDEPPDDPVAREGRIHYLEEIGHERADLINSLEGGLWSRGEEKKKALETELLPENLGKEILFELWFRGVSADYGRGQIEFTKGTPFARETEREVYGLAQAARDLDLKPRDKKTMGQQQ